MPIEYIDGMAHTYSNRYRSKDNLLIEKNDTLYLPRDVIVQLIREEVERLLNNKTNND